MFLVEEPRGFVDIGAMHVTAAKWNLEKVCQISYFVKSHTPILQHPTSPPDSKNSLPYILMTAREHKLAVWSSNYASLLPELVQNILMFPAFVPTAILLLLSKIRQIAVYEPEGSWLECLSDSDFWYRSLKGFDVVGIYELSLCDFRSSAFSILLISPISPNFEKYPLSEEGVLARPNPLWLVFVLVFAVLKHLSLELLVANNSF